MSLISCLLKSTFCWKVSKPIQNRWKEERNRETERERHARVMKVFFYIENLTTKQLAPWFGGGLELNFPVALPRDKLSTRNCFTGRRNWPALEEAGQLRCADMTSVLARTLRRILILAYCLSLLAIYHGLGGLNNRYLFLTALKAVQSKIKAPVALVPCGSSFLVCTLGVFLLCPFTSRREIISLQSLLQRAQSRS